MIRSIYLVYHPELDSYNTIIGDSGITKDIRCALTYHSKEKAEKVSKLTGGVPVRCSMEIKESELTKARLRS